MKTTILFATPQKEIAGKLNEAIKNATNIQIVAGFVTADGIKTLMTSLKDNLNSLHCLVVGSASYKAFEALDDLVMDGVQRDKLFVHLGYVKGNWPSHQQYHPTLHSKIYYFEYKKPGKYVATFRWQYICNLKVATQNNE